MKSIKALVAAIATASLVSFAVYTHASDATDGAATKPQHVHGDADGKGFKHGHREGGHPPFDKILNLSEEQKLTLKAARSAAEPAIREAHEKIHSAHDALKKAGDTNADDATLTRLSNELASLLAQQEVARVKAHRQFIAILTPEQKQKLAEFEAEHKGPEHWKEKRQATKNT